MAIGVIVLAAIYAAITAGQRASTGIEQKISLQQDVRAALDIMSTEIAMASYNGASSTDTNPDVIWRDPTSVNCMAAAANSTFKGIQIATAAQLSVQMDLNENKSISMNDPNEIITYTYSDDTVNQRITRRVNCANVDSPFLGDVPAASATARNVAVINKSLNLSMFRYYDGKGVELVPPIANIQDIRKIKITIAVEATNPDIQGQKRRAIYSSEVITRNHVAKLP